MNISTRDHGDAKVVEFMGRLDTNTSSDAQAAINALLDEGVHKLLIDFEKLDYVSSAGLRVLLVTAKRMNGSGGKLRLCNLNDTIQEVFDISGFSKILNLFRSVDEALNGF